MPFVWYIYLPRYTDGIYGRLSLIKVSNRGISQTIQVGYNPARGIYKAAVKVRGGDNPAYKYGISQTIRVATIFSRDLQSGTATIRSVIAALVKRFGTALQPKHDPELQIV